MPAKGAAFGVSYRYYTEQTGKLKKKSITDFFTRAIDKKSSRFGEYPKRPDLFH